MVERLRHLELTGSERTYDYTARGGGGGEFARPPRDRSQHAGALRAQLVDTEAQATARGLEPEDPRLVTYVLTTTDAEILKSLERQPSGIELLSVRNTNLGMRATIRLPHDKRHILEAVLARYEHQLDPRSGRPKHQDLIENIDAVRLATEQDLWTDSEPFPEPGETIWWEVWLYHSRDIEHAETIAHFKTMAAASGIETRDRWVQFPDRVVVIARGSYEQWMAVPRLFLLVAELRKAKRLASEVVGQAPREQARVVDDLMNRLVFPPEDAPAVCLLDSGVNREHPLLEPALTARDTQALIPAWGTKDHHPQSHGTGMAGIALYGSLLDALMSEGPVALEHRLESVKILPPTAHNDPEVYGSITQEAVARAAATAHQRSRVVCLAVTADCRDGGLPSAWSAAIDQLCAGEAGTDPVLVCVAAGNLRSQIGAGDYQYPMISRADCGVEDPGQAWNALTIGAFTELVMISDEDLGSFEPIAPAGDLSPTSRTSLAWGPEVRDDWPFKPDLVLEGGNWATTAEGERDTFDDLGLLTTIVKPSGALFTTTVDTSPATAAAARMAARIMARYPHLRPETVRGLMVHSARWTPQMIARFPGEKKAIQPRLRCFGYGIPDFERAVSSTENAATMVFEGALKPYKLVDSTIKTDEMHVHSLPWPTEVLEGLGAATVRLRVTLSYYVEPSPGRRGWSRRYRYASHGLRFDLKRPDEGPERFISRISESALDEDVEETAGTGLPWIVGTNGRTHGSLHSDCLELSGAQLAQCDQLAVFPVTGWWRERKNQERWDSLANYSLIVSLETDDEAVELYSAIANVLAIAGMT